MPVQVRPSAPVVQISYLIFQTVDHEFITDIILVAIAGWSSLVARRAHNPKVVGSNPAPATIFIRTPFLRGFLLTVVSNGSAQHKKLTTVVFWNGRYALFLLLP